MDWLNEIEARLKATTPGPWRENKCNVVVGTYDENVLFYTYLSHQKDAEFVAHSPEDIAKLIAAVKDLNSRLEKMDHTMHSPDVDDTEVLAAIDAHIHEALTQLQSGEFTTGGDGE